MTGCAFCQIVASTSSATVIREWPDAVAFVPRNPVVDGHVLVVPREHVADATTSLEITASTMARAAELAREFPAANILTSIGKPATQSVFHLHIHVLRREAGDQLMVPWGTTGDPHAPHWCRVAEALKQELAQARDANRPASR